MAREEHGVECDGGTGPACVDVDVWVWVEGACSLLGVIAAVRAHQEWRSKCVKPRVVRFGF